MKLQLPVLNLPAFSPKLRQNELVNEIFDPFRKKWVRLTPEEWVRQWFLNYLTEYLHYPAGRTGVEIQLKYNALIRRADIVVYDQLGKPLVITECKAPTVEIDENVFYQACMYNKPLQAKWLFLTNGIQHIAANISGKEVVFVGEIPEYGGL